MKNAEDYCEKSCKGHDYGVCCDECLFNGRVMFLRDVYDEKFDGEECNEPSLIIKSYTNKYNNLFHIAFKDLYEDGDDVSYHDSDYYEPVEDASCFRIFTINNKKVELYCEFKSWDIDIHEYGDTLTIKYKDEPIDFIKSLEDFKGVFDRDCGMYCKFQLEQGIIMIRSCGDGQFIFEIMLNSIR